MQQVTIVPLSKKDVISARRLLCRIIEEMYSGNQKAIQNYRNQYNLERMDELAAKKDGYCFIAKINEEIMGIGLGYIFGNVGFLHWLGVDKKYRSAGVGSMIVDNIHKYFRKNKCHKSGVYTDLKNKKLLGFYIRKGYKVRARLPDHWFHLNIAYLVKNF